MADISSDPSNDPGRQKTESVTGKFTKVVEKTWDLRKTVKNRMRNKDDTTHSRRQEVIKNTDTAMMMQIDTTMDKYLNLIHTELKLMNEEFKKMNQHLETIALKPHSGG